MIISTSILKNAIEKYSLYQSKRKREGFTTSLVAEGGVSAAFTSFLLVIALIFFVLEIIVLFYAVNMAIVCTKGGPERIVNVVLAIVFTIPYVLLNTLFNQCAKQTLRK
jgi:hypothetical protein